MKNETNETKETLTEKEWILSKIELTKECIEKYDPHHDLGRYNMRFLELWLQTLEEELANLK